MKKTLLALLLLLNCFFAFAQRNFKPGYIIQHNDTIRGLVDQKGELLSAAQVSFKKSENASIETFTPLDVQGYGLSEGYKYETQVLETGDSTQTHFFTVLVKGNASLYSFRDKDLNDHFYFLKNDSLNELIYYKKVEQINGRNVAVPYNLFRGTLRYATQECPALAPEIKKLRFTDEALIQFVVKYNQCSAPASITYIEKPKKAEAAWGVLVGGSSTTLNVNGGPTALKEDQTYQSTVGTNAGVFFETSLPMIHQKFSLRLELLYHHQKYQKAVHEELFTYTDDYDVLLDFHYLKVPLILKYTFPVKKINPFVSVGFVNAYAVSAKQEVSLTRTSPYVETYGRQEPFFQDFKKYAQGYMVSSGLFLPVRPKHKISLEARYERGDGFSEYTAIQTATNQFSLLAGFYL